MVPISSNNSFLKNFVSKEIESNKVQVVLYNKFELKPLSSLSNQQITKLQSILDEGFKSVNFKAYEKDLHSINLMFDGNRVHIQMLKSDGSKLFDKQAVIREGEKKIKDLFKKEATAFAPPRSVEKILAKPVDKTPFKRAAESAEKAALKITHPTYSKDQELEGLKGPESLLADSPSIRLIGSSQKDLSNISESTIDHSYMVNGREVGHQAIQRYGSVERDIDFCQKMLTFLKNKALHEKDRRVMQQIQNKIEFYNKELERAMNLKKNGATWLNSNYFRDLIRQQKSYYKAIDHYSTQPINMRYQQLDVNGQQEMGFFRVGVMSDMTNGWFSVADLEKMKDNPKAVLALIKKIEGKWKWRTNQKESAAHAVMQLKLLLTKGSNYELRIDPTAFENLMNQRKVILEKQMMHLLNAQVGKNQEKIKKALSPGGNRQFTMAHLGLLNPKKAELDKTGWMHDERVEIEDMEAIFKEFRGKELVFDGTGPIIDGNVIHLPYQFEEIPKEQARVKLNTYFFNVSPQGHMENDGMQEALNKAEMNRLMENPHYKPKMNEKVRNQLLGLAPIPSREKGYPVAEELALSLHSIVDGFSIGCLSAKDRTGYLSERCMLRKLPSPHTDHPQLRRRIFDPSGPAVRVVQENTPRIRALKVNPSANLPGYTALDKPGILWRTIKTLF